MEAFMKSIMRFKILTGIIFVILVCSFLAGCAFKKSEPWGNEKNGFILAYRPESGTALKYDYKMDSNQVIEVMGNEMEGITTMQAEVFMNAKDKSPEENLVYGIGFNSCEINVTSPQGDMTPDMSDYIGPELIMKISGKGKLIEMQNKEKFFPYENSFVPVYYFFQSLIYILAENPVKVGDSWTATDSQTDKFGDNELKGTLNYTFTVLEKVIIDNSDCLKINMEQSGDISGTGFQMGTEFSSTGKVKVQGELLFAYKEGYFREINYTEITEMTISMQGMDIPMNSTTKYTIKLIE